MVTHSLEEMVTTLLNKAEVSDSAFTMRTGHRQAESLAVDNCVKVLDVLLL